VLPTRHKLVARSPPRIGEFFPFPIKISPAPHQGNLLGAQRRLPGRPRRRSPRPHRPQRRRKNHPAQNPLAHHQAHHRLCRNPRPRRQPARSWHRLSPRTHRPRKHFFKRRHPRHEQARHHPQIRRNRSLRRARKIYRHSRKVLLQRHVRPPGLRRSPHISNQKSSSSTRCPPSAI